MKKLGVVVHSCHLSAGQGHREEDPGNSLTTGSARDGLKIKVETDGGSDPMTTSGFHPCAHRANER